MKILQYNAILTAQSANDHFGQSGTDQCGDNYACDASAANICHGLGAPHVGDTCTYDFVYVKCTVQVSPKAQQMQEDVESRYSGFERYCQETLWKLGFWAQLA